MLKYVHKIKYAQSFKIQKFPDLDFGEIYEGT